MAKGLLQLAGVVSGAGQGLAQTADRMTYAWTLLKLQEERDKAERDLFERKDRAAERREEGATARHTASEASAERRFVAEQEARSAASNAQATHYATETARQQRMESYQRGQVELEKERVSLDRTRNEAMEASDRARIAKEEGNITAQRLHEETALKKLDLAAQHDTAYQNRMLTLQQEELSIRRAEALKQGKLDPKMDAQVSAIMKELDALGGALKNATLPDERNTLKDEIHTAQKRIDNILGFQSPKPVKSVKPPPNLSGMPPPVSSAAGLPSTKTEPLEESLLEKSLRPSGIIQRPRHSPYFPLLEPTYSTGR